MKTKIQIKSVLGNILYEYESDDNCLKKTVEEAVKQNKDLFMADLGEANLYMANLRWANLERANLEGANLRGANLRWANLGGTENIPFIPLDLPEGEFIAYKKIKDVIVKLKILEDSKRSRATGDKCRCDKALVLELQDLYGKKLDVTEIVNDNYATCTYKVGEIVEADKWDDNRWLECSHGIHFFLDRQNAVDYE